MTRPPLLDRMIAYLAQTPGEWILERELLSRAVLAGYEYEEIMKTLTRLKYIEHIGSVYSKEMKSMTFRWYPPSPDSEFRQAAIDNF